jgi:GNAT superfamily N-acetyltransferase
MAEVRVAQATLSEMALVQALGREVYTETFQPYNTDENMEAYLAEAYNLPQLEAEWREPHSAYFLAWVENVPAGFLRLRKNDEVAHELGTNTLELQRLYIQRQFHGKGVAAKLMETYLQVARARAVEWLWLGVWEKNFRAQAFYQKWGFRKFGEHVFQMGDDPQTDWLLCRKL